jgi:polyisoprenoid-binding protein YceI
LGIAGNEITYNMNLFIKLASILLLQLAAVKTEPQPLTPSDSESSVQFRIKNFGFSVTGTFKGLQGNIRFDPNNLAGCRFEVSIDAKTVNTGVDMRDKHLRKSDYFDVENYPQIKFVSVKISPSTKSGTLFIFGKLTIKNVTKDISFPFTAVPAENGYLFKGEFKINRRDFKVGGGSTISDNLTVMLSVVAKKA